MVWPLVIMASLALAVPAKALSAADDPATEIPLPSGAKSFWQDTRQDETGGMGLTYRFRFIVPDLALRVPATSGMATDFTETETSSDAPLEIHTETGEVIGEAGSDTETQMIAPEDLPSLTAEELDPQIQAALQAAEEAADAMIEDASAGQTDETLPAAPDAVFRDEIHDDVIWLCQNWALHRIADSDPRPSQIVISLSDRKTEFGTYDPEALQLFEAFAVPKDKDLCEWMPW